MRTRYIGCTIISTLTCIALFAIFSGNSIGEEISSLLREGKNNEAKIALKKLIDSDDKDYISMIRLGAIYQDEGDLKKARANFDRAVKTAPQYPDAHFFLGRLLHKIREYKSAVAEFDIFRDLINKMGGNLFDKERYLGYLEYISEAYYLMGEDTRFQDTTTQIINISPSSQNARYNLGVYHYTRKHNRPMAFKYFNEAVRIDPASETGKRAKYAIEYMRNNPDPRFTPDFSFIEQEYKE